MKLGFDVLHETTGPNPEIKPKDWGAVVTIAGDGVSQMEKETFLAGVADLCYRLNWRDEGDHIMHQLIPQSRREWVAPIQEEKFILPDYGYGGEQS